jgi:hypothetical protein
MYASELIGQKAFRVDHYNGDWSYTDKPVLILEVSDKYIKFQHVEYEGMWEHSRKEIGKIHTSGFIDDNWIPYDPRTFKTISVVVDKNLHRRQSLRLIRALAREVKEETPAETLAFAIELSNYHAE